MTLEKSVYYRRVDDGTEEPESITQELAMFDWVRDWMDKGVAHARGEWPPKPAQPGIAIEYLASCCSLLCPFSVIYCL